MIGVMAKTGEATAVEEFFELFKTPWEPWQPDRKYEVVIATTDTVPEVESRLLLIFRSRSTSIDARHGIVPGASVRGTVIQLENGSLPIYGESLTLAAASGVPRITTKLGSTGLSLDLPDQQIIRLGYDLFEEIGHLLADGQPVEWAHSPTADLHVALLREWILAAGIVLVEIPPTPAGHPFIACLTHDIDFFGIRRHRFDATMWGFLYRATLGALIDFARRRIPLARLARSLGSAASLPLVHAGLVRDFWLPFEWYLRVERELPATYFVIPFKGRAGERLAGNRPQRRACAYDVDDLGEWPARLTREGCEVALHGIDAWHSAKLGEVERARVQAVSGGREIGVRMHWLLHDERTPRVLEDGGFAYDSTGGYNETPGYRHGTGQVFRPPGCRTMLELPLHVQDGALFLAKRLNLRESDAWNRCEPFIRHASRAGGVLTVLWHDRSHAAERFWGDFYLRLLQGLKVLKPWFATATQAVDWFRRRREATFVESRRGLYLEACRTGATKAPAMIVRVHRPAPRGTQGTDELARRTDYAWDGVARLELDPLLRQDTGSGLQSTGVFR